MRVGGLKQPRESRWHAQVLQAYSGDSRHDFASAMETRRIQAQNDIEIIQKTGQMSPKEGHDVHHELAIIPSRFLPDKVNVRRRFFQEVKHVPGFKRGLIPNNYLGQERLDGVIIAKKANVSQVKPHLSQRCFLNRLAPPFGHTFADTNVALLRTVPIRDTALIAIDVEDFLPCRALAAQKSMPRPASESLSGTKKNQAGD